MPPGTIGGGNDTCVPEWVLYPLLWPPPHPRALAGASTLNYAKSSTAKILNSLFELKQQNFLTPSNFLLTALQLLLFISKGNCLTTITTSWALSLSLFLKIKLKLEIKLGTVAQFIFLLYFLSRRNLNWSRESYRTFVTRILCKGKTKL